MFTKCGECFAARKRAHFDVTFRSDSSAYETADCAGANDTHLHRKDSDNHQDGGNASLAGSSHHV